MIRVLLVDDEEPARCRLRALLGDHPDVQVVGEAADGDSALQAIVEARPDLVFLDIQMPERTGLDVVAALSPPRPRVVFCTAFDQYAVDAFEHHAVDYLLKPLNRDRLAKALDRVRAKMTEDRSGREWAAASVAQARQLPQRLPQMSHLDYSGICRTALGIGGDYYDFLQLGPKRLGLAVGDVSGKGLFAGLLVAALQARVQSLAPRTDSDLVGLATELNRVMYSSTESNRYATFFFGIHDDETRRFSYVNAGHCAPLVVGGDPAGNPRVRELRATSTVIGLLPDAEFRSETVQLEPGETLLIFSDGLPEATNGDDAEFGTDRLASLIDPAAGAEAIRDEILRAVDAHRGASPPADDLTLVVARVR